MPGSDNSNWLEDRSCTQKDMCCRIWGTQRIWEFQMRSKDESTKWGGKTSIGNQPCRWWKLKFWDGKALVITRFTLGPQSCGQQRKQTLSSVENTADPSDHNYVKLITFLLGEIHYKDNFFWSSFSRLSPYSSRFVNAVSEEIKANIYKWQLHMLKQT